MSRIELPLKELNSLVDENKRLKEDNAQLKQENLESKKTILLLEKTILSIKSFQLFERVLHWKESIDELLVNYNFSYGRNKTQ